MSTERSPLRIIREGSATAIFTVSLICLLRFAFEFLDGRHEQVVFDVVVGRQIAFAGEDVEQHVVELVAAVGRTVFE